MRRKVYSANYSGRWSIETPRISTPSQNARGNVSSQAIYCGETKKNVRCWSPDVFVALLLLFLSIVSLSRACPEINCAHHTHHPTPNTNTNADTSYKTTRTTQSTPHGLHHQVNTKTRHHRRKTQKLLLLLSLLLMHCFLCPEVNDQSCTTCVTPSLRRFERSMMSSSWHRGKR